MTVYRKRPVEVEAIRWDGRADLITDFIGDTPRFGDGPQGFSVYIQTLEGEMCASPGDWIVRGVQGEFYPVKPDIFEATYERVAR